MFGLFNRKLTRKDAEMNNEEFSNTKTQFRKAIVRTSSQIRNLKIVDRIFIVEILQGISFYDEEQCEAIFSKLNHNDETDVKLVIRYRILPVYYMKSNHFKENLKNSLKYYLSYEGFDDDIFKEIFYLASPAFDLTENSKDFFKWLWDELFEDENYY